MAKSTLCRAWKDTEHFRHRGPFFWVGEGLGALLFVVVGALLLPEEPSIFEYGLYPVLGGFAGGATVYLGVYLCNLFRAPYRQRNEAIEHNQEYLDQIKKINQKYSEEINELQKKLVDSILQEKHGEHLDRIKDLISNWMGSLSIPRISEVMPGTTSDMDNVKSDFRFVYLKEHLPLNDLWQNFNVWDSSIQEYLDKCKALRYQIRESWRINDTQATNSFADPIMIRIDGEEVDFNFRILFDPELGEKEMTHQYLLVNGTEVVRGTLVKYAKNLREMGHYRCLYETLGMEYQRLADEFLNLPLIAELRQLSSSLITISSDIQGSLRQILEKADYINHTCRDCPIRQETT